MHLKTVQLNLRHIKINIIIIIIITLTAFSNFCESLKIKNSLELLNRIFENSSPKGIFGPNMSVSPNWSLTANSRSLQAAAIKGQYHAIFSNTLKSERRFSVDSSQDIMTKFH